MSRRGFRILGHVSGGGRYVLGAALVSSSYGTAVSTGPSVSFGLLAETGDFLLTETGDFIEIEHV